MGSSDDRPGAPRRRAWGSLSRAQIVETALAIARAEGLDALTIRRLAADLGASRMALYRHVADKDALVGLVMNAIAEHDLVPPGIDEGPWPHRLRLLAAGMRRELAAYPGMVEVLMTQEHSHGPGALRLVETILTILADAGLDERQAARHYMIFIDLVLGRLDRELHGDPIGRHRTASLVASWEESDYPRLRAAAPHLREADVEEIFDAELDMLIHAIEAAAR
ncbi:TetR/AcrR family transcriptional regulator [Actinoallomurus acaciae]|uniref:TetR/AcrR family transcriptional regulator n=1 Tax=Actinoallomurus acaciae TaxID=502577 RepID=A0ABV5YW26_9ACTN